MVDFPTLKTGAITQYPSERRTGYSTTVVRFVDGSEQRWREQGSPARRWVLRLASLDESEAAVLAGFFDAQAGRAGHFSFEDPWDASVHADCSFEQDSLPLDFAGEGRSAAVVTIRENK
jgi:Conserved hypothetical protein 2217 (DUF2460)